MSPASRRIFLYWLLLLIPTLVIGAVAIQLLRREQSRIETQSAFAREARRAAVTARARLVVENVELLIGDVQSALLDTLGAEPSETLEAFLQDWEHNNPLVRTAFLSEVNGTLLRPVSANADENGQGFLRRFASRLRDNPPWSATEVSSSPGKNQDADGELRKEVASNVAQIQSARRDVQQIAKARDYRVADQSFAPSAASTGGGVSERQSRQPAAPSRAGALSSSSPASSKRAKVELADLAQGKLKDASQDRRGWKAIVVEGRLHLIGWIQLRPGDPVRGVELALSALLGRLGSALPSELASDEGYVLEDDHARVVHQSGAVQPGAENVARIPIADTLLPGWNVVGLLSATSGGSSVGGGFLGIGVALVILFLAAILAGGWLLLRQARRSELEAAQKTSFVGNVSHEFKTPLTTIRLYAELLEQGRVKDRDQGDDYLRTIGRETERLTRLVNNALDFSRLEQGQKKFARDQVDLSAELQRLLDTHERRLEAAGLALKRVFSREALLATTDRDAVEQIVLNLLDNACKYAESGGEVTVAWYARGIKGAEIRISDRGPGVPENQRERIFEKFHRVNDALTAEKTGAGLGLSIARQLARGLGGELICKERAGGGAEFILTLP